MIWKHMVEDEAFYASGAQVKQRYIAERPKTYEVGDQAPGRIGTSGGWRIAKKYASKSNQSLPEIMSLKDAKLIFNESGYRPAEK
ncbi:MAG: hypothetical protein U5K54_16820 [Cytophagales bacterium]|nr:hypothetical protein [Cytophagales bacterium]